MALLNDADRVMVGAQAVARIYVGTVPVWSSAPATYAGLGDRYPTYADLTAAFATYADMKNAPGG